MENGTKICHSATYVALLSSVFLFWYWNRASSVSMTPMLVEFEHFANNITAASEELGRHFPAVLVVSETLPYPAVTLAPPARLHVTKPSIDVPLLERVPPDLVATSHVLLLPDFVAVVDFDRVAALAAARQAALLALPAGTVSCERVVLDERRWTLHYADQAGTRCDGVRGPHGLLLPTALLWQLADPFCRPSPDCLYVQTSRAGLQTDVVDSGLLASTRPPLTARVRHKLQQHRHHQRALFLRRWDVKRVVRRGRSQWLGCRRDTARCFPSLVGDTPAYLLAGRWTPPCCLRHLRRTARHVFATLRACGARFWLEGGSLLGAVRSGDIIPWDSDVDVGVYQADVPACAHLHAAVKSAVQDEQGFVWEKAPEGRFFRVQYSASNRVHVDVFPFYSRNGTMTKDTWFASHRQDCEFPESFLTPLETIPFVGVNVTVPNRARQLLELKFGAGVVESPQYPVPDQVPFPVSDELDWLSADTLHSTEYEPVDCALATAGDRGSCDLPVTDDKEDL